jgi:hypothetical protein
MLTSAGIAGFPNEGHVAQIGAAEIVQKILVANLRKKRPLGMSRH